MVSSVIGCVSLFYKWQKTWYEIVQGKFADIVTTYFAFMC